MKSKEHGYNDKESCLYKCSNGPYDESNSDCICLVGNGVDVYDEERDFAAEGVYEGEDDVKKKEHEKLAVTKPYAVSDPGAVVVHIQDTALACGAVMATN